MTSRHGVDGRREPREPFSGSPAVQRGDVPDEDPVQVLRFAQSHEVTQQKRDSGCRPQNSEVRAGLEVPGSRPASAFDRAIARVLAELVDAVRHGHFDFRLTCEVISRGQRRLVLHAGKSYQFLIPQDACEGSTHSPVDSRHGRDLTHHDLDAAHRQHGEPAAGSAPLTAGARAAADA